MTAEEKRKWLLKNLRPIIGLPVVSLLICGILFPLVITGIGQAIFPYQANGELAQLNGKNVGSVLIAQSFTSPMFFQTRNETASPSASGVDPDITLQQAYSQIPGISNATGIPIDSLTNLVNQNQQGTLGIFGSQYVDPLQLNLLLIKDYPSVYSNFTG